MILMAIFHPGRAGSFFVHNRPVMYGKTTHQILEGCGCGASDTAHGALVMTPV